MGASRNRRRPGPTLDWVGSSAAPPRVGWRGGFCFVSPLVGMGLGPTLPIWPAAAGSSFSLVGLDWWSNGSPVGISIWTPTQHHTTDRPGRRDPQFQTNHGRKEKTKPPRKTPGRKPPKKNDPGKMVRMPTRSHRASDPTFVSGIGSFPGRVGESGSSWFRSRPWLVWRRCPTPPK